MKRFSLLILFFLMLTLVSASLSPEEEIQLEKKKIQAFLQDSVDIVNASSTWNLEIGGVNLTGLHETICVLDSGINFNHPDLTGKNLTCTIDCVNKSCLENCSVTDDHGHGTHVAGIVAANGGIKGIAPEANLIGVKVLDETGGGNGEDLYNAINWCITNSENYNISVITMSLGTNASINGFESYCDSDTPPLTSSINLGMSQGISIIAATGNDGNKTHMPWPACITNVTAVGNTDKSDLVHSTSNNNNLTDFLAPGISINSTSSSLSYEQGSGTSMSAPHVAGAFAIMNQFLILDNEQKTMEERENIFKSTGKIISDGIWNKPRIDIYSAIYSLSSLTTTLIEPLNNTYTNSQINFTCDTSLTLGELKNTTFYLWNSTNLIYTETKNISGESNSTEFNYSNLTNQNYLWNCETKDNKNRTNFHDFNYTLTFDNITPEINLTSPVNDYNSSTESMTFTFNLTESNKNNCSLYIDGSFSASNTTLTGSEGKVTTTISNGNHNWTINCTDLAGNIGSSNETRNITVNYIAPAQETSSSSSSSSSYSVREYSVEESILKKGYTKELRKNEIINFKIQEEEHSLKLISFDEKVLEVLIQSEPQTILISLGEEKKITFDNKTYSLLVKFNSVNRYEANITIKEINELIFPQTPSEEELKELREKETIAFENKTEEETKNKELNRRIEELILDWKNKLNQEIIYSSIRILVGILVIIYFLSIKKRKKK